MKHISRSSKKVMKRFGVVILSAVMILTGALALSGTVDFGKIAWNDEGDAYAKVAEKTEKSIGDTFPELTKTKSSDKLSKDETVYVIMDADGNKEETLVSEWLKNPEKLDKINDKSNLSDIKNTSGDEEYTKDGSKVVWNAGGNDIKYTGKSDSDLPVSCEVTYYLDGEEVSADEIAGQKGEVEIHFNYYVNVRDRVKVNGKGYDVEHPYIMASGLMLDNEHFKDVEVTNGKCVNESGNTVCVGIAFPGIKDSLSMKDDMIDLPENVVVKAVTDDFRIDGTYTVALSGLLGDLNISSNDMTDKIDDVESALNKLSEASGKLVKGTDALKKGTDSLEDGTSKLSKGASSLKTGTSKLSKGTSKLASKSGALSKGVNKLYKGSKKLSDGTKTIKSGTKAAAKGAEQISNGLSQISGNSKALNQATAALEDNIFDTSTKQLRASLVAGGYPEEKGQQQTLTPSTYNAVIEALKKQVPTSAEEFNALKGTLDNVEQYVQSVKGYTDGVDQVSQGMDVFAEQMKALDKGAEQVDKGAAGMKAGLSSLSDSIPALKKGISKLDKGASQINEGASKLSTGASQLDNGTEKLDKGASDLEKGMSQFDKQGIKKFVSSLKEYDIDDMLNRVNAVSEASSCKHFVGGTTSKIAGETKIIFKTKEIEK